VACYNKATLVGIYYVALFVFTMKFFNHEYDSVKAILLAVFIVLCGVFIITTGGVRWNILPGLVNFDDSAEISITLSSIAGAQPVESGIYGTGTAKFLDEVGTIPSWQDDITESLEELSPTVLRFPAGGLVKYSHVWTDHMNQPLSAEETTALVNGNEIRGNGWILEDRIEEEEAGNDGELAEITAPKPKYGNLSYLEGFQNLLSRNFIHDFVDITEQTNSDALFVVNINYGTPAEAAQQIEFLINQGVTIRGVEMGNEVYSKANKYFMAGSPSVQAPIGVTNYLNDADEFRTAIEAVAPGLSYAVVSAPKKGIEETVDGFDGDTDYNGYWNTALATQMGSHGYTNYIMHFYAPFTPCIDEVATGIKSVIFECGKNEMKTFRKLAVQNSEEIVFPATLDWYASKFPGKNMWLTEWNINQDQEKTASKFANSVLHGIFTQDMMTMMNDANVRHDNFIKFSIYHTLATDGGNALLNKRRVGNVASTEPEDIGGFVRRTPYFAMKSMKDIYRSSAIPMETTFTINDPSVDTEEISIHAYKKNNGDIIFSVTNTTEKTLRIGNFVVDGQMVNLDDSSGSIEFLEGASNAASRGETEFAVTPDEEANMLEDQYSQISDLLIPGFGVGTFSVSPEYIAVEEITNNDIIPSPDNNVVFSSQNITYATTPAGTNLDFDLSKPSGAQNPLPLIFFLHGGAFEEGGLDTIDDFVNDFTGSGYATAEVEYRGTDEGLFPAQVRDINGAVRYVRAHANELGIDPNKIAIAGSSSGAMLISMIGASSEVAEYEGTTGGNTGFSSKPNAVIDLFGSLDPDDVFGGMPGGIVATFLSLFGCANEATCDEANDAVAANYVDSNDPPFLIIHGTADAGYQNSVKLQGIFTDAGIDSTFISAPGIGHDKNAILTLHAGDIVSFLDDKLYFETTEGGVPETDQTGDGCGFFPGLLGLCNDDPIPSPPPAPPVNSDTVVPRISISTPIDKATISGGIIEIQAQSTDAGGVAKVDFYQGTTLLGSDVTSPYKFGWDTMALPSGMYTLRAVSYDNAGNSATAQIKVRK